MIELSQLLLHVSDLRLWGSKLMLTVQYLAAEAERHLHCKRHASMP